MENPTKMDDLGGKPTMFGNIHICAMYYKILREIRKKSYATPRNQPPPFGKRIVFFGGEIFGTSKRQPTKDDGGALNRFGVTILAPINGQKINGVFPGEHKSYPTYRSYFIITSFNFNW